MQPASQLLLQSDMTQRMPSLSIYMRLQLPINDAALMHEVPDQSHEFTSHFEVTKSVPTLDLEDEAKNARKDV